MSFSTMMKMEPVAAFIFDTSPAKDYSKRRIADVNPSNIHPLGLFNMGRTVPAASTFSFDSGIEVGSPWTIITTVRPYGASKIWEFSGTSTRLSTTGDGRIELSVDGSTVHTASPVVEFDSASVIAVVREYGSVTLYQDGNSLASIDIDDESISEGGSITIGGGSAKSLIGMVALFDNSLPSSAMRELTDALKRMPLRRSLSTITGSAAFVPDINARDHFTHSPVVSLIDEVNVISDNEFHAIMDGTTLQSIAGEVTFVHTSNPQFYGVAVYWDNAREATVEYSVDSGDSWSTALNGVPILDTFELEDPLTVVIRVTFPSGIADTPMVSGLRLVEYETDILNSISYTNRPTRVIGQAYHPPYSYPLKMHGAGMRLIGSGILEFDPDDGDNPDDVGSLEVVVNFTEADLTGTKYIMNSAPEHSSNIAVTSGKLTHSGFSSVYVNGSSTASNSLTLIPGASYHIVANYSLSHNSKVTFGRENESGGSLCSIELHNGTFNAAAALQRFKDVSGWGVISALDSTFYFVIDDVPTLSAPDWTVTGT